MPEDAPSFRCGACNASNYFFGCGHCGAASQVASTGNQPPTKWECEWCGKKTSLPLFGRLPVQSAGETKVALQARNAGRVAQEPMTLGGFIVAGSSGSSLALGAICSVSMVEEGVAIHVPEASLGVVFSWEEIDALQVSGRGPERTSTGGQANSALSTLLATAGGRSPSADTVLRIGAGTKKVVLRHPRQSREQLRATLQPIFTRWEERRVEPIPTEAHTSGFDIAVEQLERLVRLRAAGGISDAEYEQLRARYVAQLEGATGDAGGGPVQVPSTVPAHAVSIPRAIGA